MFSRSFRLRYHKDIDFLMKRGQRLHSDSFVVWFLQSQLSHFRVTVIVGKKCEKSAVRRNKIKRRLREALRTLLQEKFTDLPNLDMVFWVRHENTAETFDYFKIRKEVEIALGKLEKIALQPDFGKLKSRHKLSKLRD